MLEIKPDTVIALSPGIVLHSLPDQDWYHAFSVESGDQYRLNKTSFWILENISDGITWDNLLDKFIIDFDLSMEQGQEDLKTLIMDLYTENILRREEDEKEQV